MKNYKLVNNTVGWVVFAIAAATYCLTIEPTASFWDCPEFILSAYKLEVGHPPGAPFFMLLGNFFTQFASSTETVAAMVNIMSALLSALTILFLFWSITHLARKLVCTDGVVSTLAQLIVVQGAGLVGALAYTWSDTFWFSAVEGEVYAFSSMFTALVFWLILKWEEHADEPHSDRWLVLIAYCTGVSIGVHLLNLLCLPAIVLVYYYKKRPAADAKGSLIALAVSFVLLAGVLYGVVPGIVKVGGWFELLFVNVMGFSFNTGFVFYIFVVVAAVVWAVYESYSGKSRNRMIVSTCLAMALLGIPFYGYGLTSVVVGILVIAALAYFLRYKRGKEYFVRPRTVNTTMLCLLMIMIGYSSYALIVIRSTANTPMDQNSPEDVFSLGSYLNREQYGSRPLLYGQAYTSQLEWEQGGDGYLHAKRGKGAPIYQRVEKHSADEPDRYETIGDNGKPIYAQNMMFPRMYSDESSHVSSYEAWLGGMKGRVMPYNDPTGRVTSVRIPTQLENIRFFLSYQVNFMYWRYFMWNFAGRQNDIQGHGEMEHGNWVSGISLIDNMRLGDQSKLPDSLKANKGHNVFYMLPLLLGLIGLFWQAFRGEVGIRQFWVVFFLFFMTGLAIVIYLNQTPLQPRERDYAYAGSFYAFAIWIGLGVAAIAQFLRRYIGEKPSAIVASIVGLAVPLQMVSQTWDDHDRSGRYTTRDFGRNYLMTLSDKGGPVVFTNGDNDTFPLWYSQEVEGTRTDARVCNLSYLQTDWYIDQMRRPAYDSPALPINWKRYDYVTGTNEVIIVRPELKQQLMELVAQQHPGQDPFDLQFIMKTFVCNEDEGLRMIPTDTLTIPINKEAVRGSDMMQTDSIPDKMVISLAGMQRLTKAQLMMLEILSNSDWKRPVYVASTVAGDNYFTLDNFFSMEGLAYRITPYSTGGVIDVERTYDNLMNRYRYGNLSQKGLYLDETVLRLCYTHRSLFTRLAEALIAQGDTARAKKVLEYCEKVIPAYNVPYISLRGVVDIGREWLQVGETAKARAVYDYMVNDAKQYLTWYATLKPNQRNASARDIRMNLSIIASSIQDWAGVDSKYAGELERTFNQYAGQFTEFFGQAPQ